MALIWPLQCRLLLFSTKFISMSQENKSALSEEFLDKPRYFIQDNDAQRASRNLRAVFFDYLRFQQGNLDTQFDDILNDVEATIKLLELIAGENKEWREKVT